MSNGKLRAGMAGVLEKQSDYLVAVKDKASKSKPKCSVLSANLISFRPANEQHVCETERTLYLRALLYHCIENHTEAISIGFASSLF